VSGVSNEILVYEYPAKFLIQKFATNKAAIGLIDISNDGSTLVTVTKIGPTFVTFWDFDKEIAIVDTPVADDYSFMSINPFDKNLICCGYQRRVTILRLDSANAFSAPAVTLLEVQQYTHSPY
jgi:hypothetical protein